MKTKYFLRGFGLGVIIVTIVMFAFCSYQTSNTQIIKKAQELGMVYQNTQQKEDTTTESVNKQTEEETTTPQATTETQTTIAQTTVSQTTVPQTTVPETTIPQTTPVPAIQTEAQTTTMQPQTQAPTVIGGGEVQVNIHSGMTGVAFARMLEQADVIENGDDFITYLVQTGYSHRLRTGTYVLKQGMSYDEIVAVVTIK